MIVHVIPTDLLRGGQVIVRELSERLSGEGKPHVALTLFAAPSGALRGFETLGVRPGRLRRAGLDPRVVVSLRRWLRQRRPTVVVAHGGESLKYVVCAAPRAVAVVYNRIGIAPPYAHDGWRRALYRRLAARAAVVVAISPDVEREVVGLLGVEPGRVRLVPNGRDPSTYSPSPSPPPGSTPNAVFVGHLTRSKRPLLFLDVVAAVRARGAALDATVVGDGPLLEAVRAAAPAGVDVLGARHDVDEVLRRADLFVFTSLPEGEGMPGVLIEAAMSGLPAVATRVPGADAVVVDGVTGFVVDADDREGLGAAVERLAVDADLRHRMGLEARRRAAREFDLATLVERWRQVLEEAEAAAGAAAR